MAAGGWMFVLGLTARGALGAAGWVVVRRWAYPNRSVLRPAPIALGGWVVLAAAAPPWFNWVAWFGLMCLAVFIVALWEGESEELFQITERTLEALETEGWPRGLLMKLREMTAKDEQSEEQFLRALKGVMGEKGAGRDGALILKHARLPSKQGPRYAMAAVAAFAHVPALVALHDGAISHLLIDVWGNLGVWLALLTLLAVAFVSLVLLSLDTPWRLSYLNGRALHHLHSRDENDPRWGRHFELRHALHRPFMSRRAEAVRRLLLSAWEYVLGAFPRWINPAVKPARAEMYLRAMLEKTQPVVHERTRTWRAESLRGRAAREAVDLLSALEKRGWRLLALGDYLFCPHEPCASRINWRQEDVRTLAFDIDAHLLETAALRQLARPKVEERTSVPLLEERLNRYYDLLAEAPGLARVIEFRKDIRAKHSSEDLARAALRNRILEWAGEKHSGEKHPKAQFVLEGLLARYRVESDSAGLIDACRRLSMLGVELSVNSHLELGEAFYRYAFEIDPKGKATLSDLALSQAASHFFEAGASEHLKVLNDVKRRG